MRHLLFFACFPIVTATACAGVEPGTERVLGADWADAGAVPAGDAETAEPEAVLSAEAEQCRRPGWVLAWEDGAFRCIALESDAGPAAAASPRAEPLEAEPDVGSPPETDAPVEPAADASEEPAADASEDVASSQEAGGLCPWFLAWLCAGVGNGSENGNDNGNGNGSGNNVTIIGVQISR